MLIPFNVDANTARLIGRENVSKLEGAILELIKNAYDADGATCILYFEESTNTVYLVDNGRGMDEQTIKENWMTIGFSIKKDNFTSSSGRIQTGAKGIGRFALDRVSDICTMFSKTQDSSIEWNVNWSDFDSGKKITEICAKVENVDLGISEYIKDIKNEDVKALILNSFKETGTLFKMNYLRDDWSDEVLEKIKTNLATLIPPEIESIFQIYLFSENNTIDQAKVLVNDGIYSHDYKIEFNMQEDGNGQIVLYRDEFDFKSAFNEVMLKADFTKEDKEYFKGKPIAKKITINDALPSIKINSIGEFHGTLYFAKLATTKKDKEQYYYKDFPDRRDSRNLFGGVKIYRDNFRVRPYGEPNSTAADWLLLSNRKAKSPAAVSHSSGPWKVAAEQVLGSVHISRLNLNLPDQSNREGIVETKEFALFRQFILFAIQAMEKDRQYVARKLRKYQDEKNELARIEREIAEKAEQARKDKAKSKNASGSDSATGSDSNPGADSDNTNDSNNNFSNNDNTVNAEDAQALIDQKENIIKDLEDENRLLRALATTGIVTNTYIHEIKTATHLWAMQVLAAKDAINKEKPIETVAYHIDEALNVQRSFNSWFKVTLESVKKDKRTMKYLQIEPFLKTLEKSWSDVLKNKNIKITMDAADISFKCFPYDIESIFGNLIANSKESFKHDKVKDHIIEAKVYEENETLIIEYSDNGNGLDQKYKKNPELILEAFETSKRDNQKELIGTGMGMWIINKIVKEYKGEIDLSKNIESQRGFYIKIQLIGALK